MSLIGDVMRGHVGQFVFCRNGGVTGEYWTVGSPNKHVIQGTKLKARIQIN